MDELIGGLYPKKRDNQPDFVIGKLSINVAQFREWMAEYLKANQGSEWINIDMLVSKAGKGYAKLDTWEPENKQEDKSEPVSEDIPF
jgi:hypothetical protein